MYDEVFTDSIHEECGVIGAYDVQGNNVAPILITGLLALQHRGQESCGLVVGRDREHYTQRGCGLINDVFAKGLMPGMHGPMAIGHVRYPSEGSEGIENAQPMTTRYIKGQMAIAFNGSLTNSKELHRELAETGAIFQTAVDTEIIAYLIARERVKCGNIESAIANVMQIIKGACSIVVMSPTKLIAARDALGFRPLCLGRRNKTWFFASETCALTSMGAEFIRDVKPGEVIAFTPTGEVTIQTPAAPRRRTCIFEYIYFSRPDSDVDGVSVHEARRAAGRLLAAQQPVDADIVFGVPDSGTDAAFGYAEASGIPIGMGFVKSRYIGRTFIAPEQSVRETGVRRKLSPLTSNVKGKRVIMVDDSIVRGTTLTPIVQMLRDAGATQVHVRVASPPFRYPCYFGTDIPDASSLVCADGNVEKVRAIIGADTLEYLAIDALPKTVNGSCDFCAACFTGDYPTPPPSK